MYFKNVFVIMCFTYGALFCTFVVCVFHCQFSCKGLKVKLRLFERLTELPHTFSLFLSPSISLSLSLCLSLCCVMLNGHHSGFISDGEIEREQTETLKHEAVRW